MLINQLEFALIFPFIFFFYWLIPIKYNKYRNLFLLIVSYLLYMNWKPAFAIVLLGVTLVTYLGGRFLESNGERVTIKSKRVRLVWLFALLGLLPLLGFKYYNFLNDSISAGLASVGLHFEMPGLNWAVPVGISFFTFQAVGYLLDVYHQRINPEKNFLLYALFVSFFPQITSGPISTASSLIPQFKRPHTFNYDQAVAGLRMLLWGLFLKVAIADRAGVYVDTVYSDISKFPAINCALASFLYTIQIYCDFAGYSLLAIGIAKLLGFDLINNFERPYLAASVTEFWKRWHISLTKWLTTHVYINLGGNRCSKAKQYFNIMITFLVSGLWHGANWTFVIWGALHGFFQIIEKALFGERLKVELKRSSYHISLLRLVRIFATFSIVSIAWIFFRMPTVEQAFSMILKIGSVFQGELTYSGEGIETLAYLPLVITPLFFYDFAKEFKPHILSNLESHIVIRWGIYLLLIAIIMLLGVVDGSQFIYVSF